MENEQNKNSGVCCDVCGCEYNRDGCNCCAESIKVTSGNTENMHFCRTYKCKDVRGE